MEIRPILSALLRSKTGPILVALQVALSLAILANAAHIVNERRAVAARPSGLSDEHSTFYITVRNLANDTPEQQLANIKRQTAVLRTVGGVKSVANVSQMPLSRNGSNSSVAVDPRQDKSSATASTFVSGDSVVQTFGLKLVEGRDFLPAELLDVNGETTSDPPPQVILTKPLADKLWPDQPAVGKTMYFGTGKDARGAQVVGVVAALMSAHAEVGERGEHAVIIPARLYGSEPVVLYAIRTEPGQRDRVMKEAEAALTKIPGVMIIKVESMDENRHDLYRNDHAIAWMLATVTVLLLLVTASGIVGMATLWVNQRRKQIGVRRALGARKVDILRYFITENFIITTGGVAAGLLLAVGLNQLLVSQLELPKLPIVYLAVGSVVLWLVGIAAVYAPAWRASSISPAIATRSA